MAKKSAYEEWAYGSGKTPKSPKTQKKWWARLVKDTRRKNLDKISRTRKPKTVGEWFDLMDLKQTTKGYRKKR